jgi:hypothetical protein
MPRPDGRPQRSQPAPVPVADRYRRFAEREARGRSPLYERFALGVAGDPELLALLESLPPAKQQPNLLFAAVLYLGGRQPDYGAFRQFVLEHADQVVATMLARRTQTNEVGRCALLLPLLASLPGPLALVEVGASGAVPAPRPLRLRVRRHRRGRSRRTAAAGLPALRAGADPGAAARGGVAPRHRSIPHRPRRP